MADELVTRREFERVVSDHERRLAGHDGLYKDLQDTREELVKFTEALKAARDEMVGGLTDHDRCQQSCAKYRTEFEKRIRALERFRWQFGGAVLVIVALPTWVMLFLTLGR